MSEQKETKKCGLISEISSFISHHSSLQCKQRFTLIELLVVIAIIAILAGMLLPALQQARERGKSAVCMTNLNTAGKSFNMYSDAMNDFYPYACESMFRTNTKLNSNGQMLGFWPVEKTNDNLWGSDQNKGRNVSKYICPSCASDPQYASRGNTYYTYGYNYYLGGFHLRNYPLRFKRTRWRFPSLFMVMTDANNNTVDDTSFTGAMMLRHSNNSGANILFGDGHVSLWSQAKIPCKTRGTCNSGAFFLSLATSPNLYK